MDVPIYERRSPVRESPGMHGLDGAFAHRLQRIAAEDTEKSRAPVRDQSPHFPVFPEFQGASYLKRYDILCQRLVKEQLYSTAALLTSKRDAVNSGDFGQMSDMTSLKTFVTSIAGHIAAEAARK